jgi:RND family efflux transporter MFP subunit
MLLPTRSRRPSLPLALLLSLALGCAKPPEEEQPPPAVVVWQAASVNYLEEWTEFVGTTMPLPDRVARITSPVEGKVVSVLTGAEGKPVAEGQKVERGTPLVKLDTTVIDANLAKLVATQEALQAEEEQAQIAAGLAERELTRLENLKKTETGGLTLVTTVDLERATGAAKDAKAKVKAAGLRTVAGAKEVEATRKQLALYTLTAPIAGRLGRLQVAVGQTLSVGTAVADLVDVDEQIDVICFIPPSVIGRVKADPPQLAHVGTADKDPAGEAQGVVTFIADQAEPDTGNFAVKVRFANAERHLRANSVVRFCLQLKEGHEGLSLPEKAVQEDEEKPTVVAVLEEKRKNRKGEEETIYIARRLQAELGLRARHLHQIEIVGLTDAEKKEPGKPKLRIEVKEGQFYIDGSKAQFVVEGAQGVQSGDIVKLDTGDD